MRHFHRTQVQPDEVLAIADAFFPTVGEQRAGVEHRGRTFSGVLGTLQLKVWKEGGHYTFVQVDTDQMGESRLDRNAKRFFVELKRAADERYRAVASF